MSETPQRPELKIQICEDRGSTSTFIDVDILPNGDFQLSGQDVGQAPKESFGDSDYEYWVTVSSEHKDRLLLALVDELLHGDTSASSKLMELLRARSIPYQFDSWM